VSTRVQLAAPPAAFRITPHLRRACIIPLECHLGWSVLLDSGCEVRRGLKVNIWVWIWGTILVPVLAAGCKCERAADSAAPSGTEAPESPPTHLQRLEGFKTKLVRKGPAPQPFDPLQTPPKGVSEVSYLSDGLRLKAWFALPPNANPSAKVPGVVYLHGGFAFGADDFEMARPFLSAGMALLCPMLRGESGNPGASEMYLGEVRDAKSAVAWLAERPEVNAAHLYGGGARSGRL